MHLNLCCSWYERLQDGQPSTGQTPAQVTCAHCQRSRKWPQRLLPFPRRFRRGEPHIVARLSHPSTPREVETSASLHVPGHFAVPAGEPHILARFRRTSTPCERILPPPPHRLSCRRPAVRGAHCARLPAVWEGGARSYGTARRLSSWSCRASSSPHRLRRSCALCRPTRRSLAALPPRK